MILKNNTSNPIFISIGTNESQDHNTIGQIERFVGPLEEVEIPPERIRFALDQLEDLLTRAVLVVVDENPYDEYVWRNTTGIPDFDGKFHLILRSALEFPEIQDHGVSEGMFPKINFTGGGVTVADAGGGRVDVTIETNTVLPYVRVTSSYLALAADLQLGCRVSGPVTITLVASPVVGQWIRIKDEDGGFLANPLTVIGSGGALIDGAVSYLMATPYQANDFVWNGDYWSIE